MAFDVRAPESLAWIAGHPWAYPALETVHLAGMALPTALGAFLGPRLLRW